MPTSPDILSAIGNTSLVRLRKVVPPDCADIWVKLEWENPTGSMKDRAALAMIDRARERGSLPPGGAVVETVRAAPIRKIRAFTPAYPSRHAMPARPVGVAGIF